MRNFIKSRLGTSPIYFLAVLIFIGLWLLNMNSPRTAGALELQNRSVQLDNYTPGAATNYHFQFFVPSTNNIGSIVYEFCTNSAIFAESCTAPAGLDVTAANITGQTGNTGFSIDNADTTVNQLVITRPSFAGSIITTTYDFSGITDSLTAGQTIFVRVSTHASIDGSGATNDSGGVAYVTGASLNVAAQVPPFLRLCVGLTVAPDCSTASGDSLDLGDLSTNHASAGQSQFATGTNAVSGYVIYALGTTMTSGNDVIPALTTPTPSFPGNDQFGINLRANSNPASGQDPSGAGTGSPTPDYDINDQFVFNNGDTIASSSLPTDYNRMTVSYLVNINHAQNIGIYSTTITYVATVTF